MSFSLSLPILMVKDLIYQAISAKPHAALAWAGVLVILPVNANFGNSFAIELQSKRILQFFLNTMMKGKDAVAASSRYLLGVLIRCLILESTYNQTCASLVIKEYVFSYHTFHSVMNQSKSIRDWNK